MARVTGIGGVFFKAKDPKALYAWYEKHLGMTPQYGSFNFTWNDGQTAEVPGSTAFAFFPQDTKYFNPSQQPFMINLRVDDLDALLASLKAAGVWVDEKRDEADYGKFGWIMDPEGNRIELWEPK